MSSITQAAGFTKGMNTVYATLERSLDVAGYIPVINSVSSVVRAGVALSQMIYGVALFILAGYNHLSATISNRPCHNNPLLAQDCLSLLKNGALNLGRTSIEASGVFGAISCFIYDCAKSHMTQETLGECYGYNVTNIEIHRPFIAQLIA